MTPQYWLDWWARLLGLPPAGRRVDERTTPRLAAIASGSDGARAPLTPAVGDPTVADAAGAGELEAAERVIPLFSEELQLARRTRITGRVKVQRVTRERQELVEEMLGRESVEVEHVPIGRVVAEAPPVREEDGVVVVPVIEERLVTERRLYLKEEIRIRRTQRREQHREQVTLRAHEAIVTRLAPDPGETDADPSWARAPTRPLRS